MIAPSRRECERAVLGLAISDPIAFRAVLGRYQLGSEHFREFGAHYAPLLAACARSERLEPEELAIEVSGQAPATIASLLDAAELVAWRAMDVGQAAYFARLLREHEAVRSTRDAAAALATAGDDLGDARAAVGAAAAAIAQASVDPQSVALGPLLRQWYARLTDAYERKTVPHVPLGRFLRLDAHIGGLLPGELLLVGGATSMGKSSLARCIVTSMASAGTSCAVVSLEDAVDTWLGRIVADDAEVESMRLRYAACDTREWTRVTECIDRLGRLPLFLARVTEPTTEAMLDHVRMLAGHGARLVVVDYVQAVHDGDMRGRHVEISRAVARLKCLAAEIGISVILESQLSREAIKEGGDRPPTWAPKDSGDLENAAEAVAILWCPLMREHEQRGHVEDCINLHVVKAKNGRRGIVPLTWDARRLRFDERTP